MKKRNNNSLPLKIAILSDVHGNLPALEAVIADAQKRNADQFWNLGDFLGYGPYVNEVVDLLFETCSAQVIGNYDLKVLTFPEKQKKWAQRKKKEKYLAFAWAWEKLSKKNSKRLKQLPGQTPKVIEGFTFLLTHGGPAAVDEIIGPDTTVTRLQELATMTDAATILCGHTHFPFLKKVGQTTFINPGSIGRPEGQEPRSCYVIIEISSHGMKVSFQKVPYDIERLSRAIHAAGLPEDFTKMFESGKNLDQIQDCKVKSFIPERSGPKQKIDKIREFARHCEYEQGHSEQVTVLAQILFDKLQKIHPFGAKERFLLTCAGLLHDIGWIEGQQKHHKRAMNMILEDRTLPFTRHQREVVALIARYHRKVLPQKTHPVYAQLPVQDQQTVEILAGILRIADGLDRSHMSAVKDIDLKISSGHIEFCCKTEGKVLSEMYAAQKKADLFERNTGFKTRFSVSHRV